MAKIELLNVTKRFGKLTALDDITLEIRDKEFFVLFGPAGAGKTTILNCIAGIQIPEAGMVKIGGEVVNQLDPSRRNVAMVFENYALYPHMTVYDNIASPLRSPAHKKDEAFIREAVNRVSALMKIDMLLNRLPSQLSNGQRQRVALGRALVRNPNVFLLDEPLAHLDAKLRNLMRGELKEMQQSFDTTSIYVTHDFMEAMSLGDRIAIINKGRILQVGTGDEVYYMPANEFVAQLMGEPEINLLDAELSRGPDGFAARWREAPDVPLLIPSEPRLDERLAALLDGKDMGHVRIGIRPQNAKYSFEPGAPDAFKGTVYSFETIGNKSVLVAQIGDQQLRMIAPNGLQVKLDQDVYVSLELSRAIYFGGETAEYVGRYDEAAIQALVAELAGEEAQAWPS